MPGYPHWPGWTMPETPKPAAEPEQAEVSDAELFAELMRVRRAECVQDAMAEMRRRFCVSKRG